MKAMRKLTCLTTLLSLSIAPLWAGTAMTTPADPKAVTIEEKTGMRWDQELSGDVSYVGGARMQQGNADLGHVSEIASSFKYVATPELKEGKLLRFGVGWDRYSFGLPNAAPLPNTLQAVNAVIGLDLQFGDSWLFRIEASPGVYSDFKSVGWNDVNVPIVFGGSYIVNQNLQFFFGLQMDLWRDWPVLPGVGLRWKFADQWTLMLLPPKPRIEFEVNNQLTLFAGCEIRSESYHVNPEFGNSHGVGHQNLNDTVMTYTEYRVGAGLGYKIMPSLTVELEGGYMPYREFDFHRADTTFDSNGGSGYGGISVKGTF